MKKVKVEVEALLLSDEEMSRLKNLLQYCRHRISNHPGCGVSKFKWADGFIDYMLEVL